MPISSDQLEAFAVVAREAHFSKAASTLGITQSALSLRIQKLEDFIGATLFIRGRAGVKLTDAGHELVRYSTLKSSLEADVLGKISGTAQSDKAQQVHGLIRVGGFSSVMRSMVLPSVSEVLRAHPKVSLKLITRELDELPAALQRAEVDFLILDRKLDLEGVESIFLGNEINVLAQSKTKKTRKDVFLDHDEQDQTTYRFLKEQAMKPIEEIRRIYLDDIYGIIDGVSLGLGRAVLPRHLVERYSTIEVDSKFKALESPVFLNYYRQPYYSRLHALVQGVLEREIKSQLKYKPSKRS